MAQEDRPEGLSTFGGVFTPSILTILGIILFLRLGYVVGHAGLMRALIIIGIANAISILTSISIAAVSTNLKVKGGGVYYLISRTLGVEFGGALGIVLYLAQAVSIGFYCIGFGEAVAVFSAHPAASPRVIALLAVAGLFVPAWFGSDWATRLQYLIMAFVGAALVSFYLGAFPAWDAATVSANWHTPAGGPSFWMLFAIFFPAVTGFTQGVNMSGDLADPGRSIPRGTFLAVGISMAVYFSAAVLFSGAMPLERLSTGTRAMHEASRWGFLIDAGVISATLSSALASYLSAPRILQSIAVDKAFTFLGPFAKGHGPADNPRRAVLLSAGIAGGTIAMGNLNMVAAVVSMFFLISYGLLNYATYFEASAGSPSFRPRFRFFHYRLSLLGALACLGTMLAIDVLTGVVAVSILFGVYQYLKRTVGPVRWADSRRSYHLSEIKGHLQGLVENPDHPRDWRPFILALSNGSERRRQLLQLADWIAGRSGYTTVARIMEGSGGLRLHRHKEAEQELEKDIRGHGFSAFQKVVCAPETTPVLSILVQSHGIGSLRPNTILLNWYSPETESDRLRMERMIRILRGAYRLGCNILICQVNEDLLEEFEDPPRHRLIDIWWQNDATGRLSLLLAYLMQQTKPWEDARLRVLSVEERHRSDAGLEELSSEIKDARIDAEIEVPETPDMKSVIECSCRSDMVFLPFRFRTDQIITLFDRPADELMRWMSTTVLIQAAEDIDLDAEPESGEAARRAEALDTLEEARQNASKAQKAAEEAEKEAQAAHAELSELKASALPEDRDKLAAAENAAEKADMEAERARRKAAKTAARVASMEKEVEAFEPQSPEPD